MTQCAAAISEPGPGLNLFVSGGKVNFTSTATTGQDANVTPMVKAANQLIGLVFFLTDINLHTALSRTVSTTFRI